MAKEINICQLPVLALNEIAKHLEAKDLIHLTKSASCFEYLRRFLPKYQEIVGPDPWVYLGFPETYIEGPEMNHSAKSITMSFQWKDQVIVEIIKICLTFSLFRAMDMGIVKIMYGLS